MKTRKKKKKYDYYLTFMNVYISCRFIQKHFKIFNSNNNVIIYLHDIDKYIVIQK